MLYITPYEHTFSRRREEAAFQRDLARRLLGYAMEREHGVPIESLTMAKGPGGKPYFADHPARFNLSHCRGLVCCAVGQGEIGVDCEPLRPYDPRLAERICTRSELAFLENAADRDAVLTELWTLKESLMKLSGRGMAYGFQNAAFSLEGQVPVCLVPGIQCALFRGRPGWALAVSSFEAPPAALIEVPEKLLQQESGSHGI